MAKGIVKWFDTKKGFGFIRSENGDKVFVHYTQIEKEGFKGLKRGEKVTFETFESDRGPQATKVQIVEE
jgi:cold shock protein